MTWLHPLKEKALRQTRYGSKGQTVYETIVGRVSQAHRRSRCKRDFHHGLLGEEKVAAIADVLAAAVARLPVRGPPLALQRDDEARALWAETYKALSGGHPGLLGYVTARAEAQVTRLACLYALADLSTVVRVEHLRAALAVWRFSFESARYQFGDRTGNPVADKIREALQGAAEAVNDIETPRVE